MRRDFPKKATILWGWPGSIVELWARLSKVENCQVGVFAAYASRHGYALVDKRLYIPQQWFTEHYTDRREKCEVPEGLEFKTKAQLAVEMFQELRDQETLPFRGVHRGPLFCIHPRRYSLLASNARYTKKRVQVQRGATLQTDSRTDREETHIR